MDGSWFLGVRIPLEAFINRLKWGHQTGNHKILVGIEGVSKDPGSWNPTIFLLYSWVPRLGSPSTLFVDEAGRQLAGFVYLGSPKSVWRQHRRRTLYMMPNG